MSSKFNESSNIIVALDYNEEKNALDMANTLDPTLCILKDV